MSNFSSVALSWTERYNFFDFFAGEVLLFGEAFISVFSLKPSELEGETAPSGGSGRKFISQRESASIALVGSLLLKD